MTRLVPLGANGNGPRKLAYRIRRNQVSYDTGFYINVCAFASPATLNEVSRQLKIDERVLRHAVYKRSLLDCMRRIPDVDDVPNIARTLDPTDADFELHKFIGEFQQEFPHGFNSAEVFKPTPQEEVLKEGGVGQDGRARNEIESSRNGATAHNEQEESVRDILAQLKGTKSGARDGNLSWLSDLKKPKPPGNDST